MKQSKNCQVCHKSISHESIYYQRNRICEEHSKADCCIVDGNRRRWCQQCCKFQQLEDFDGARRTCRARLKSHNERRRHLRRLAPKRSRAGMASGHQSHDHDGMLYAEDASDDAVYSGGDGVEEEDDDGLAHHAYTMLALRHVPYVKPAVNIHHHVDQTDQHQHRQYYQQQEEEVDKAATAPDAPSMDQHQHQQQLTMANLMLPMLHGMGSYNGGYNPSQSAPLYNPAAPMQGYGNMPSAYGYAGPSYSFPTPAAPPPATAAAPVSNSNSSEEMQKELMEEVVKIVHLLNAIVG